MTEGDHYTRIAIQFVDEQPWTDALSESNRQEFIAEAAESLHACAATGDRGPFLELVSDWRETAAIWADPALAHLRREDDATE